MKTLKSIFLLMAVLAIASCSENKNDVDLGPGNEPEEGYLMIQVNNSQMTRATDAGIQAERTINSLHVYLFNHDNTTPTVMHFGPGEITTTGNVTRLNNPIRTSIKDKWGYIGANLTEEMIEEINGLRNNLISVAFTRAIGEIADLPGSSFVMFTDEMLITSANIYPTENEANTTPVSAMLRRLAVKSTVYRTDQSVFDGPGQYDLGSVEFAWRRINRRIYYIQHPTFEDPNYTAGSFVEIDRDNTQDYMTVNYNDPTLANAQYATENTFLYNPANILTDDATCISIRIPFQPANYTVNTGGTWQAQPNSNLPGPGAPNFWVVMVNGGVSYYFGDAATAQQFWNEAQQGLITVDGVVLRPDESAPREYTNGWCYYNVYPNHNGVVRDEINRYNIMRNQYYRLAIRRLSAPGDPDWDFDTGQPITEYGYIQFNLEVEEWELIDEDINM